MSVLCPRDVRALVEFRSASGAHLHRCGDCRGLWLPAAVVGSILGYRPRVDAKAGRSGRPSWAGLCCPDDGSAMAAVHHRGVEIDVCSRCGGVWLDSGELERLLALQGGQDGALSETMDGAFEIGEDILDRALFGRDASSPARHVTAATASGDAATLVRPAPVAEFEARHGPLEIEPPGAGFDVELASTPRHAVTQALGDGAGLDLMGAAGDALQGVFEYIGEALSGL